MILLDANILLRMAHRNNPTCGPTIAAVFKLRRTDALAIMPQCLFEFMAVATRSPVVNGVGMDIDRADK